MILQYITYDRGQSHDAKNYRSSNRNSKLTAVFQIRSRRVIGDNDTFIDGIEIFRRRRCRIKFRVVQHHIVPDPRHFRK